MTESGHSKIRPVEFREKIKLDKPHRWILYAATFSLWLSGALWLLLKKPWAAPEDSWTDSAWPPFWLEIHGAAAMIFLILLGTLLVHIRRGWWLKRNRVSGLSMLSVVLFLTLTGWMLYYLGNEPFRDWASKAHWAVGLILPLLLIFHIALGRKLFKLELRRP